MRQKWIIAATILLLFPWSKLIVMWKLIEQIYWAYNRLGICNIIHYVHLYLYMMGGIEEGPVW